MVELSFIIVDTTLWVVLTFLCDSHCGVADYDFRFFSTLRRGREGKIQFNFIIASFSFCYFRVYGEFVGSNSLVWRLAFGFSTRLRFL